VIDKNNEIIIGHGRHAAAVMIGLKEVPCLKIENLNEKEIRALRLIDNRIAETGWDHDLLKQEFEDMDFDFSGFGVEFELSNNEIENSESKEVEDVSQFIISIHCANELEQQKLFDEFSERGLKCKLIM
jgi:ParB-like chromosome segregation protein Spo0J